MKRILALAMLAVGLMLFVCFAAAAEETTVTGRIFEGEWVYATVEGSVQINVIPAVDSYLVQVTVNTDGYEREFALDYICALDTAAGSLISEPGAVMYEVFRNDDYDVVSQEEVYSDGSAVFSLDEAGQLIWHDGKKDEDVTLERPIGWIDPDYIGPGHHFVGIWEEERVDIEIEERMEDYTVFISGSDGASEGTVWGYLCQYDPETDSLVSMENAGYKIHYWFSDTDEYSDELVYENGSAVFTINRAGLLIWEDQTEDAGAGRLFEKVPEEGDEGLYADIQTVTDSPAWVTDLPAAQDPQTMQLFVIAGMGMDQTTAVISMHQRDEDGSWKQILSTPGFVGRNGLCLDADHAEGCGQTPIGVYRFNRAFGLAEDPGCVLPYYQADEYTYWSGDPDRKYNQLVDIRAVPELALDDSEHITDYKYEYRYCLNISFNEDGTPGRGSAIFLHCFGDRKPYTGGCVAIPENIMKLVMQSVSKDCVVVIDTLENLGGSL